MSSLIDYLDLESFDEESTSLNEDGALMALRWAEAIVAAEQDDDPELAERWDITNAPMLWRAAGWLVLEGYSHLDIDETAFVMAVGFADRWEEIRDLLIDDGDEERSEGRFINELL